MKLAFLDLTHNSFGITTNTVPLAAGLIATYVKRNAVVVPDIRIFKSAEVAAKELLAWKPDIIGLSQYAWNTQLNTHIAALIKAEHPACIVVAGGPNQAISIQRRVAFLQKHPAVDLCVSHDGELPMIEIVNRIGSGEQLEILKYRLPAGCYCIDADGTYRESPLPPPRLSSLDVFGAVYAEGVFDEFLSAGQMPFVQTHRGCPFSCAFCHASDPYMSKVLFLSPAIFEKDMEYLARRYAGRHEVTLYVANTNMSLFEQDFPIARIIQQMQHQYDWPKYLNINSGKDPKKLLEMLSIINFEPAIALQTLTPTVLQNIKRKNIPFEDYLRFQRDVLNKTGLPSGSEIIMSLPGETKQTFLNTTRKVLNSGVQNFVMLTFMNLQGTPTSADEVAHEYEHIIRYRVVPRQYSVIAGQKIFDTEEVIVGTKYLSQEEYVELRALYFTITVFFNSAEFFPIRRLLIEHELEVAEWIFRIHRSLSGYPDIHRYFREFVDETRQELFGSENELLDFYTDDTHFSELTQGKRGDNLSRKYKLLTLAHAFGSCLALAVDTAQALLQTRLSSADPQLFIDLHRYLASRDLAPFVKSGVLQYQTSIELSYDVPAWLADDGKQRQLIDYCGRTPYLVTTDVQQNTIFQRALRAYGEVQLSLQVLYRDGMTQQFWPKWIRQNDVNLSMKGSDCE